MDYRALSRLSRTLAALGTLSLITLSSTHADPVFPKTPGAFISSATTLRAAPMTTATKVASVIPGVRADVVAVSGGWLKLRLPSGKSGWAPADRLALNTPAKEMVARAAEARRAAAIAAAPPQRPLRAPAADPSLSAEPRIVATLGGPEPPIEEIPESGGTALAPEAVMAPRAESRGDRMVRKALTYRGWRYRWGATGNGAFDCSGLTQFLYAKEGKYIPRTAREQYSAGVAVARENMEPGDLVFFRNTGRRGISHVGMYIGNGQFIHAAGRRRGVRVDDINGRYYVAHWAGARRY